MALQKYKIKDVKGLLDKKFSLERLPTIGSSK